MANDTKTWSFDSPPSQSPSMKVYPEADEPGTGQVQSDWNEVDVLEPSFILNKPTTLPNVQTFVAGQNLSGEMAVAYKSGKVWKFDPLDDTHYLAFVGLTKTSALANANVDVVVSGPLVNMGWGLAPSAIYYAIAGGLISITPPVLGIVQPVGQAMNANAMLIKEASQTLIVI
jgi:hypothetical protein